MTEDDTYLSMIAVRQVKKVKNTCSGASNLSLCMSYVVKRDTRAYSRLPLPLMQVPICKGHICAKFQLSNQTFNFFICPRGVQKCKILGFLFSTLK